MTIVIWKETAFQKWHFLFEELWSVTDLLICWTHAVSTVL